MILITKWFSYLACVTSKLPATSVAQVKAKLRENLAMSQENKKNWCLVFLPLLVCFWVLSFLFCLIIVPFVSFFLIFTHGFFHFHSLLLPFINRGFSSLFCLLYYNVLHFYFFAFLPSFNSSINLTVLWAIYFEYNYMVLTSCLHHVYMMFTWCKHRVYMM